MIHQELLTELTSSEEVAECVIRAQSGDRASQEVLCASFRDYVFRVLLRRTGDYNVAEDLTQETFIKAMARLGAVREPKFFRSWLGAVARRTMLNHFVRRGVLDSAVTLYPTMLPRDDSDIDPSRIAEAREDLQCVKDAAARLSGKEQILFQVYYIEDHTVREAAEILGDSEANVKRRAHYLKLRVLRHLGFETPEELI
ncbi:MAG: RNA polymerase sigma factor [Bdellovibrionota bacterium]